MLYETNVSLSFWHCIQYRYLQLAASHIMLTCSQVFTCIAFLRPHRFLSKREAGYSLHMDIFYLDNVTTELYCNLKQFFLAFLLPQRCKMKSSYIKIKQHWSGFEDFKLLHLKQSMITDFFSSRLSTLYKPDTSLTRTAEAGPDVVCLKESWLYPVLFSQEN